MLGVLAADEDVERVAEGERRRGRIVDHGIDEHAENDDGEAADRLDGRSRRVRSPQ